MSTKNILMIVTFTCCLLSCKKTEVSGVVYSTHNVPVPNASIRLYDRLEDANFNIPSDIKEITTTDNNGHYYFSFSSKRKHDYGVGCIADSGATDGGDGVAIKETNNINLYLK